MVVRSQNSGQADHEGEYIPGENSFGQLIQDMCEVYVREHSDQCDQVCTQDGVPALDGETVIQLRSP